MAARSGEREARRRIVLTAFLAADEALLAALQPFLEKTFEAKIDIGEPAAVPDRAYDPTRQQHRSAVFLELLAQRKRSTVDRELGITDVDLYTPDLNFVFGEADAHRGVAVFSTARLYTADRDRFVQRVATEAIHELAHTYGLTHCRNPQCVMWFSNTLSETDRKGTRFCSNHAEVLERALAGPVPLRTSQSDDRTGR